MPRLLTRAGRLGSRAKALGGDQGGAINVLLTLAIVPIVGLSGLGIDCEIIWLIDWAMRSTLRVAST